MHDGPSRRYNDGMPYLVDGHNLIGKLDWIELSDPDDERQLAEALADFCRRTQRAVTTYFDGGQPGGAHTQRLGRLTLNFVSSPRTADDAIAAHVRRLGGEARNWTVVSSDAAVQAEARSAGARVLSSEAFAALMTADPGGQARGRETPQLSEEEVAMWEAMFKRRGHHSGRKS